MSIPDLDQAIRTIDKLALNYKALKDIDKVLKTAKQAEKGIPTLQSEKRRLITEVQELTDKRDIASNNLKESLDRYDALQKGASAKHREALRDLKIELKEERTKLEGDIEVAEQKLKSVKDAHSLQTTQTEKERKDAQLRVDSLNTLADQLKSNLEKVA